MHRTRQDRLKLRSKCGPVLVDPPASRHRNIGVERRNGNDSGQSEQEGGAGVIIDGLFYERVELGGVYGRFWSLGADGVRQRRMRKIGIARVEGEAAGDTVNSGPQTRVPVPDRLLNTHLEIMTAGRPACAAAALLREKKEGQFRLRSLRSSADKLEWTYQPRKVESLRTTSKAPSVNQATSS